MARKRTTSADNYKRLMRELIERPESAAMLGFTAGVERALRPIDDAIEEVVKAIAAELREPTEVSMLRVDRVRAAYESITGQSASGRVWDGFVRDAQQYNDDLRRRPPAIEEVLENGDSVSDIEYDLGIGLGGIKGIWHRLWSALSMEHWQSVHDPSAESIVPQLRSDLESRLGRSMTEKEWAALVAHAHRHCDEVLTPVLAEMPKDQRRS